MDKDLILIKAIIDADYQRHIKRFEKQEQNADILFLGDSMLAYAPLKKMGLTHIINQGIPGDTTTGVINRLSYVYQTHPKHVLIHIGSNDLVLTNHTDEEIISNIKIIVSSLINKNINVHLLSITPVLEHHPKTNQTYIKNRSNAHINTLNEVLKTIEGIETWIDVNHVLKDGSHQLNEHYTTDGIHLNDQGYEIFLHKIGEYISIKLN